MEIQVSTSHEVGRITYITPVDLPDGKTDEDIDYVYVKWGRGEVQFKDGTTVEFEEDIDFMFDYREPDTIQYRKDDEEEWRIGF